MLLSTATSSHHGDARSASKRRARTATGTLSASRGRSDSGRNNRAGGLSHAFHRAIVARDAREGSREQVKRASTNSAIARGGRQTASSVPRKVRGNGGGGGGGGGRTIATASITPTFRAYRTYAHIVETEVGLILDASEERVYSMIESNDVNVNRMETFLDEKFIKAVHTTCGVKLLSSVKQIRAQILGQFNGTGNYRKWNNWYQQDDRLGLLRDTSGAPFVVCVSTSSTVTHDRATSTTATNVFDRTTSGGDPAYRGAGCGIGSGGPRGSAFVAFMQTCALRPIRVAVGRVLWQSEKISLVEKPRVDSLQVTDLKTLRGRSLYYRRIFLLHLLIYSIVAECECWINMDFVLRENDRLFFIFIIVSGIQCGNNEKTVLLVVEPKLRPLLQMPTSLSIALHGDPLIGIHYLTS